MGDLPAPPVPEDADLRTYPYLPLEVGRLRDCDLAADATGDAFRAAVLLWCASWHQLPAGSLPTDERALCRLAGMGRDMAAWEVLRDDALRGWHEASDGRMYHKVIADRVLEALESQRARAERGRAGAKKRWGDAQAMPKHCLSNAQAMPKQCLSICESMLQNGNELNERNERNERNEGNVAAVAAPACVGTRAHEAKATAKATQAEDNQDLIAAMDERPEVQAISQAMTRAEIQATSRLANPLDWLMAHPKCFHKDNDERRAWGALIQRYADHGPEGMEILHDIYLEAVKVQTKDGHKRIFLSWFADFANSRTDWEDDQRETHAS
jgi:hypothetical protein